MDLKKIYINTVRRVNFPRTLGAPKMVLISLEQFAGCPLACTGNVFQNFGNCLWWAKLCFCTLGVTFIIKK